METIICKSCFKRLPIGCFYVENAYHNGVYYRKVKRTCKKCLSLKNKIKYAELKGHDVEKIIIDEAQLIAPTEKPKRDISWIAENLKHYGNCYVNSLNGIDLECLEVMTGFKILAKTPREINGYILEKRK